MAKYIYEGELPTFYPRFFPDGTDPVNLYAQPGDVVDFEPDENGDIRVPPGQWALAEDPPKGTKSDAKSKTKEETE